MVRPRTPTNILKLRGADKVNPGRLKDRENEPVNKNPIGRPPTWLSKEEKKAWRIIVKESIDGVLGETDRMLVAMASKLSAKMIADKITQQEYAMLNRCLGQMGFTPTDRAKLSVPKTKPKNKFDD